MRTCLTSLGYLFFLTIFLLPSPSNAQSYTDLYIATILGQDDLVCNGPIMDFNNGLGEWTVTNAEPSGPEWGRLGDCGESGNYTGGVGDVACVSSDVFGVADHDTSLKSPEFNLNGISTAALHFDLAYWPYEFSTAAERLDLEMSYDGGSTWITIETWNTPVGNFRSTGAPQSVNLSPFVGSEESKLRFRYYDSGASDWNYYAQVDNIRLDCTGGADLSVALELTPSTVIEGQEVEIAYTVTNVGPEPADQVLAVGGPFDAGDRFSLLTLTSEPDGLGTTSPYIEVPTLAAGESFTIRATGMFDLVTEPTLTVTAPSTVAGEYEIHIASFAPEIPAGSSYTGTLVVPNDGAGNIEDGCTPFVNAADVSGNIVIIDSGNCSFQVKAENAQDAGAQAVILRDLAGIILLSNPVTRDVTIPVVIVSQADGGDLLGQVSLGVDVELISEIPTTQDFDVLALARGDSADPDLENSYEIETLTVLADRDGDGVPDNSDGCALDPAKSSPQFCGCGAPDVDADGTGVVDCLLTDELSVKLQGLYDAVKALRPLKLTGQKKKDKKRKKKNRERKKLVQEMLDAFEGAVALGIASYDVTAETDLAANSENVSRKSKKARRTKSPKFKKLKRRALKAMTKLLGGLVTQSF